MRLTNMKWPFPKGLTCQSCITLLAMSIGREGILTRRKSNFAKNCRSTRKITWPRGSWETSISPKDNMTRLFHTWRRRFSRSEEHTSELQSLAYLVCRLLLEKKKH